MFARHFSTMQASKREKFPQDNLEHLQRFLWRQNAIIIFCILKMTYENRNKKRIALTDEQLRHHTADLIGTYKGTKHIWREILILWRPLSTRRSHLQTCHVGSTVITERVRA